MNVSAIQHMYEHFFFILSIMSIFHSAFCAIAQCICACGTQQVLYSGDTIFSLLNLEFHIFAL